MKFFKGSKKANSLPDLRRPDDQEALRADIIEACETVFAQEGRIPDSKEVRKLVEANHVIINNVINAWWPAIEASLPKEADITEMAIDEAEIIESGTMTIEQEEGVETILDQVAAAYKKGYEDGIEQGTLQAAVVADTENKKERTRVKIRKYDGGH